MVMVSNVCINCLARVVKSEEQLTIKLHLERINDGEAYLTKELPCCWVKKYFFGSLNYFEECPIVYQHWHVL